MFGLTIRFLAGRFHGTAWHNAHNEGIPEWPPSPWRLLRALVSAGYEEGLGPTELEPLLEKLRSLPFYQVPYAVDAHTRHYMPDAANRRGKVFDAFVAVDGGASDPQPLRVGWSADLSASEKALLHQLCRRLSYLGRAESWAEVQATDLEGFAWNCRPDTAGKSGGSSTTLLALASADELALWASDLPRSKKGADVPRRLWDVLTFQSDRYRAEGWSRIPGTCLVRYAFERPPFERAVISRRKSMSRTRPSVARFAISAPVYPGLHDALRLGEELRRAAMSKSNEVSGDAKPIFSGHDLPETGHRHAMYLPEPGRSRGDRITQLLISARAGFDDEDIYALQRLRRIWRKDNNHLELILVGLGSAEDFGGVTGTKSSVLAESRVWESITPFVPTRHPKVVRGHTVDSIESQILRACEQLVGVVPSAVVPFGDRARWARFRRRRLQGRGSRGPDWAVGARLVFPEPVRGPIALGYGAHFGLGLFLPALDAPPTA